MLVTAVALAGAVGACDARPRAAAGRVGVDDFGDTLRVGSARRIVSLNPTTTELLFALGAGGRLVGRSTYDRWPDSALAVPDLGPALRPTMERLLAARPDLALLYASAENREAARRLRETGIVTAAVRIDRVADFVRAARLLGTLTGDSAQADVVIDSVLRSIAAARRATSELPHPSVLWLVWDQPLMAIGGGSFLSELIDAGGGRNVYAGLRDPSPMVSVEDVFRRDPDVILATPSGAARIRANPQWRSLRAVRSGSVLEVDSAVVERPSVRMGEGAWAIARALHPELARLPR